MKKLEVTMLWRKKRQELVDVVKTGKNSRRKNLVSKLTTLTSFLFQSETPSFDKTKTLFKRQSSKRSN